MTIEELAFELRNMIYLYTKGIVDHYEKESLHQIVQEIKSLGYTIACASGSAENIKCSLTSEESKRDYHEMVEIREKKFAASDAEEFEMASRLRDEEWKLLTKINDDFEKVRNVHNNSSDKDSVLVFFKDPVDFLMALYKK